MALSPPAYRRALSTFVTALFIVAVFLAAIVIGPIRSEAARGGTPQTAVIAFWVNIIVSILVAVALLLVLKLYKGRNLGSTTTHIVSGVIVLVLGLTLADAAEAYRGHGSEMARAAIMLFACAAVDLLVGVLTIGSAFFQPKTV